MVEATLLGELPLTHHALVWLLSSVGQNVRVKVRLLREATRTERALVSLLSRVSQDVVVKVGFLCEALVTHGPTLPYSTYTN